MDLTLFDCPTYKARITAKGCADMRKRPLLTERGTSPAEGEVQLHRHPSCNDDCPILLAQRIQSKTAWQLIMERTGCDTQAKVAKKIGTYQSKVSQFLVRLGKGITPTGREWGRLLEITGLMPEELLLAARANIPAESSASSLSAAPSSPPQPSGPDLPPSTGPDGPAAPAESMPGQAPGIILGDKVPPTAAVDLVLGLMGEPPVDQQRMMGADPADVLITTEQAQELLDSAESPPAPGSIASIVGGSIATEAEDRLALAGPVKDEDCECNEGFGPCGHCASCRPDLYMRVGRTSVLRSAPNKDAQPDDAWDFYDPRTKPLAPAVWITRDHHLCVNADAVRAFKLEGCTRARLGRHIREYMAALVEDRLPCLHEDILERMPDIQATILGPRLTDAPQGLPCGLCGGFGYHLDHAETPCGCKEGWEGAA